MHSGPAQSAHERLAALVRRRLRDAEVLPPMPESMRARLHGEVIRQVEMRLQVPEPVPISAAAAAWMRWRSLLGPGALGLAVLVVLLMVVRSGDLGPRPRAGAGVVSETGARGSVALSLPDTAGVPTPLAETTLSSAAAPLIVAVEPTAGASARPKVSARAEARPDPASGAALSNLGGAVRVRRWYVASRESKVPGDGPVILSRFEVFRGPDRVELRDADGSVYSGRVQAGGRTGESAGWTYEGRGVHLPSGRVASITGFFGRSGAPASLPEGGEGTGELLDLPFTGSAVIGEAQVVDVRAGPEP